MDTGLLRLLILAGLIGAYILPVAATAASKAYDLGKFSRQHDLQLRMTADELACLDGTAGQATSALAQHP